MTKEKEFKHKEKITKKFLYEHLNFDTIYIQQGGDTHMANTNKLVVAGSQAAIDQMKYEIASEFGVNLGAEATARANGSVGGEITKRLVQMAQQQLGGSYK